jgi:hypothetical protein
MLAFVFMKRPGSPDAGNPVVDPLQLDFPISFRVVSVAKTQESFSKPE